MNFHEIIETPWKKSFSSLMRYTYVETMIEDGVFSDPKFSFVLENWVKIKELTLVDPFRLQTLIELVERTKDVSGDIVECGSYKGGTGILMAEYLKINNINKKIYLLDSFEGLPEPDAENDNGYKKGQFKSNAIVLQDYINELGLQDYLIIVKGWFKDSIPKLPADLNISLFHVDCDLYTSTMDCFPPLYPKVSEGGAIIFDDYNDGGGGEKKAVEEYFKVNQVNEVIEYAPAPQSFLIKGERLQKEIIYNIKGQKYAFDYIDNFIEYLEWIRINYNIDLVNEVNKCQKMEKTDLITKLNKIFCEVMGRDSIKLNLADTADNIEEWDSLTHIQLITEVEKIFKVRFTTSEIEEFEKVGDIIDLIRKKS